MDHVHWTWKGRRKFSTARTKEGAGDPPEGTKDNHQTGRGRQIAHSTTSLFGALTRTTWWTRHQDNNNQRSCTHHAGKPTNTGGWTETRAQPVSDCCKPVLQHCGPNTAPAACILYSLSCEGLWEGFARIAAKISTDSILKVSTHSHFDNSNEGWAIAAKSYVKS